MKGEKKMTSYKLYDYLVGLKLIRGNFKDKSVNFVKKGKSTEATEERLKRRAKAKVLEYALCNDWQYFYTQTISSKRDRFDKENLNKIRRSLTNAKIKYLLCVDRHKNGALHLHGLLKNVEKERLKDSGVKALNKHTKEKQPVYNLKLTEKYGFNSLFEIARGTNQEQRIKIAYYVAGYISKDNNREFKQRYFVSQGLNMKQPIYISNQYLNDYTRDTGLIPDYTSKYVDIFNLPFDELNYMSKKQKKQAKAISDVIKMFGSDIVNVY